MHRFALNHWRSDKLQRIMTFIQCTLLTVIMSTVMAEAATVAAVPKTVAQSVAISAKVSIISSLSTEAAEVTKVLGLVCRVVLRVVKAGGHGNHAEQKKHHGGLQQFRSGMMNDRG